MDSPAQETLAVRLRQLMDERSVTQAELARVVGLSQMTVSRWLAGTKPNKQHIKRVAIHCDVEESWLLTGQGRKELTLTERRSRDKAAEERTGKAHDYVEKAEKPRRVIHIQRDAGPHREEFRFDRASEEDWAYVLKTVKDYCLKARRG